MANLVIDIGNTLIKVAVFRQNELLYFGSNPDINGTSLVALIDKYEIKRGIISSVRKDSEVWRTEINERIYLKNFNPDIAAGIHNHYKSPKTLGLDRLAAVIGAHWLYPDQDNLVIDAGTAITYEYVDAGGNYFGGSISPGLNMRYKALNNYTSALPLINADADFAAEQGDDTESAIRSGVQNGIKFELLGFIKQYQAKLPETNIILTGGDSIFFDTLLKNSIFAPYVKIEPYLVLKGLNAAIQTNND